MEMQVFKERLLSIEKETKISYITEINALCNHLYDRSLIPSEFDKYYDLSIEELHITRDLLFRELFNKVNGII